MRCKKVQDLIMSDYIDGELNERQRKQIKDHLEGCLGCRRVLHAVSESAVSPFKESKIAKPDESVWHYIKENIEEERLHRLKGSLLERIMPIPILQKPRFALAIIVAFAIFVTVFVKSPFYTERGVNMYLEEQIEFLRYLGTNGIDTIGAEYIGLGTAIEEYFF